MAMLSLPVKVLALNVCKPGGNCIKLNADSPKIKNLFLNSLSSQVASACTLFD